MIHFLILGAGVAVVSTASILIRFAQGEGVASLDIAAVRLTLAAAVLLPICVLRNPGAIRALPPRTLLLTGASGAVLAIHFWSWIASLEYTSVASSTVLVTTNPMWVALASVVLLRERPAPLALTGVGVSLLGTLLTFAADVQNNGMFHHAMLGNLLALVGAIAASAYLLLGRALRDRLPLLAYVALAYTVAACLLVIGSLAGGTHITTHSSVAWVALVLLALGPQLIGHTAFNFALRHMSATFVALAILGEPVGAAILAWLLFGERFSALQLAGFCLLLIGIYLAARAERPAPVST